MILHSFEYSEFQDNPRGWRLSLTEFGPINLVVGKNAAGKSRLLKVIHAFTQLVAGKQKELFSSGDWGVDLETPAGEHFTYKCALENKEVVSEHLCLNGELLLDRANGRFPGRIKAANRPGEFDDFQIRPDQLAIYSKRDSIQQPHLELIADWAAGAEYFEFGSVFGPTSIGMQGALTSLTVDLTPDIVLSRNFDRRELLVLLVSSALEKYGADFKNAIIVDMARVGFQISDVGIGVMSDVQVNPPAVGIWVQESDLGTRTEQMQMSSGMFRALSAVIRMNLALCGEEASIVLLDDVGEGLDYQRAVGLISVLIEKASAGAFQLFMTSNDRFVMNEVPLDYWNVLSRQGGNVSIKNVGNSGDEFKKFAKLGLNNFDYFVSQNR